MKSGACLLYLLLLRLFILLNNLIFKADALLASSEISSSEDFSKRAAVKIVGRG